MDRAKLRAAVNRSPQFTSTRKVSLYSNFSRLKEDNPDGYEANIAAWRGVLSDAVLTRAFGDATVLEAGPELIRGLTDPKNGLPLALDSVLDTMVRDGSLVPVTWFTAATVYPVLSTSWQPGSIARRLGSWVASRVLDIEWHSATPGGDLKQEKYVVVECLREQSQALLEEMFGHSKLQTVDEVTERAAGTAAKESTLSLSALDVECCLLYLSRETQAITYDRERGIIKLPDAKGGKPEALSPEDQAIVELSRQSQKAQSRASRLHGEAEEALAEARVCMRKDDKMKAKRWLAQRAALEKAQFQALTLADQLDTVLGKIEAAATNQAAVAALAQSTQLLKSLNERTGAYNVDEIMSGLRDNVAETDAVTNELAGLDISDRQEAEVEKELQEMEQDVRQLEKLDQLPSPPSAVPKPPQKQAEPEPQAKPQVERVAPV